jgi:hypothetical protein
LWSDLAIVLLGAKSNTREVLAPLIYEANALLESTEPGIGVTVPSREFCTIRKYLSVARSRLCAESQRSAVPSAHDPLTLRSELLAEPSFR